MSEEYPILNPRREPAECWKCGAPTRSMILLCRKCGPNNATRLLLAYGKKRLITANGAARLLNITNSDVTYMISSGKLAGFNEGTVDRPRWFVRREDVEAMVGYKLKPHYDKELLNPRGHIVRCDKCSAKTRSKYGLCEKCITE